jgi:hypothetical protein
VHAGVCHADEMIYLFIYPFPSDPPFLDEREKDLSLKMIQVWTNFAIHGLVTWTFPCQNCQMIINNFFFTTMKPEILPLITSSYYPAFRNFYHTAGKMKPTWTSTVSGSRRLITRKRTPLLLTTLETDTFPVDARDLMPMSANDKSLALNTNKCSEHLSNNKEIAYPYTQHMIMYQYRTKKDLVQCQSILVSAFRAIIPTVI